MSKGTRNGDKKMEKTTEEKLQLLSEWCMKFTDEFINDHVTPIVDELIRDKAFMTLLKLWKKDITFYEQIRGREIRSLFDSKIELPNMSNDLKLKSYSNSVFAYNDALMSIVMKWNENKQ